MYKSFILTFSVLLFCNLLPAQRISQEQARERVVKYLRTRGVRAVPSDMKLAYRGVSKEDERDSAYADYYVFNMPLRGGFVIHSGDERTVPILARADKGEFKEDNMPEHIKYWLDRYVRQIDGISKTTHKSVASPLEMDMGNETFADDIKYNRTPIGPLIKTRWNQGSPYMDLCPVYNGERCPTGCLATAMAQIMFFHQWPQDFTDTVRAFKAKEINMEIPSFKPTIFDWEDMKISYRADEKDDNAVATLMAYCGASVETHYRPRVSGAFTYRAANALKDVFGYDPTTVKYVDKEDQGYSDEQWEQLIYNELAQGRPVLLTGQSTDGGHAFVCDGYDGNGLFHINWGWGGTCDGYFRMTVMNPDDNNNIGASLSDDGYKDKQDAIIGIMPPSDKFIENTAYLTSTFTTSKGSFVSANYSNLNSRKRFFRYGIGVQRNNGYIDTLKTFRSTDFLDERHILRNVKYDLEGLLTTEGSYKIVPISRQENHKKWRAGKSVVIANVDKDKHVTLSSVTTQKALKVVGIKLTEGGKHVGRKQQLQITLQNNFDNFSGPLFLFASHNEKNLGKPRKSQQLNLSGGDTAIVELSFTPTEIGDYTLAIATNMKGRNPICISHLQIIE